MDNMMKQTMTDKEMMTDLLSTEKFMTGVYNTYCCEAATPALRSCLMSLMQDTHRMQEETFDDMSARGWYQLEKAEDTKLNQEKQKFNKMATV
ncbi:MAG: spore coat protein [Clostridia bacterium]|nr:spore coat protein [Clostridia bacterium]